MFRYSLARNECVLSHSPNQIRVQTVGSVPSLPAFPLASSSSHRDCHCPHSRLARFLPARDLTCFRSDCLGDKTAVGSATIARTTACLHCPLQKEKRTAAFVPDFGTPLGLHCLTQYEIFSETDILLHADHAERYLFSIPYLFSKHKESGFPMGITDSRAAAAAATCMRSTRCYGCLAAGSRDWTV
jgi:hypothetical protein